MLHYVMVGSGRSVPVLHGGKLDHRHMIDAIAPVLEDVDGWSRLYVDLAGHGRSAADGTIRSPDDGVGLRLASGRGPDRCGGTKTP